MITLLLLSLTSARAIYFLLFSKHIFTLVVSGIYIILLISLLYF